jgi:hypothetical protein
MTRATGRPRGRPSALLTELLATRPAGQWSARDRRELDRVVSLYGQLRALDAVLEREPADLRASTARARASTELLRLRRTLRLDPDHNARRQDDVRRERERRAAAVPDGPLSLLDGAQRDEAGHWWTADGLLALGDDLDRARAILIGHDPMGQHRGRRSTRDVLDDAEP